MAPTIAESTLKTARTSRLAPASGRPKRSSSRACLAFQPGNTMNGAAIVATISPAETPATEPQAKLMGPCPEKASQQRHTGAHDEGDRIRQHHAPLRERPGEQGE